jgi:apolipoprotein N-acyltransferase
VEPIMTRRIPDAAPDEPWIGPDFAHGPEIGPLVAVTLVLLSAAGVGFALGVAAVAWGLM